MRKWLGVLVVLVAAVVLVKQAKADGMIIPPPLRQVEESGQKAVIFYDGKQETLVVSTTFSGDASEFVWVVPVPARPEVSAGKDELFTALDDLTLPKYGATKPMPLGANGTGGVDYSSQVSVVETKRVDIYDTAVLAATDAQALGKWLTANGYQYPEGRRYLLESYVNRGWYFVVAKVQDQATGYAGGYLNSGHATPLSIAFSTDKIIYPLKISGLGEVTLSTPPPIPQLTPLPVQYKQGYYPIPTPNFLVPEPVQSDNPVGITLYVFADHKQTVPGFVTDYAGKVPAKTIANLALDDSGQPWIKNTQERYLTKLTRTMKPSEMADDLIFRQANDDRAAGVGTTLMGNWDRAVFILAVPLLAELAVIGYIVYSYRQKHD